MQLCEALCAFCILLHAQGGEALGALVLFLILHSSGSHYCNPFSFCSVIFFLSSPCSTGLCIQLPPLARTPILEKGHLSILSCFPSIRVHHHNLAHNPLQLHRKPFSDAACCLLPAVPAAVLPWFPASSPSTLLQEAAAACKTEPVQGAGDAGQGQGGGHAPACAQAPHSPKARSCPLSSSVPSRKQ